MLDDSGATTGRSDALHPARSRIRHQSIQTAHDVLPWPGALRLSSRGSFPSDSWTILFWRGLFGGSLITAFLVMAQGRDTLGHLAEMGRSSWLVASLSTLGMVSFIPALQLTSVANVAVIDAAGPFVAAALAWAHRGTGDGRSCGNDPGTDRAQGGWHFTKAQKIWSSHPRR
jgi:hypothetical protein